MRTTNEVGDRHFLVELSRPNEGWQAVAEVTARARSATAGERGDLAVRLVRSVYAPESDSLFLVYRGATAQAVMNAVRGADLHPLDVSAALTPADEDRR